MDDSEVVKVLAEFMGYKGRIFGPHPSQGHYTDMDLCEIIPNYLTSYDAIAEVWNQVVERPDTGMVADRARSNLNMSFDYWYRKTPRDHAYALAKAILEAKKQDEPDDWVGDNR